MKRTIEIIIFVLLVSALGGCNLFNKKSKEQEAARVAAERARIDSIARAKADSLKRVEARIRQKQARLDSIKRAKEEARLKAQSRFHVIVGSFKTPSYADSYAKKMANEGFSPKIIKAPNGFNLVSVGGYETYASALDKVRDFRENGRYEVWVYDKN
jgi:cell division protein FtsN